MSIYIKLNKNTMIIETLSASTVMNEMALKKIPYKRKLMKLKAIAGNKRQFLLMYFDCIVTFVSDSCVELIRRHACDILCYIYNNYCVLTLLYVEVHGMCVEINSVNHH